MIQFTLGCILISLTLFFGGKDILANKDKVENRQRSLTQEEQRVERASTLKQRYVFAENNAVIFNDKIKETLINQLNLDESKYDFKFQQPEGKIGKVLASYDYTIEGFDSFSNVFSLLSDIEKINGLTVKDACFNCEIENDELKKSTDDIGFKVEGDIYVYSKEK